jgi:diguanylate cyclase (GGDEF)-like protein/PAS domain S-box-containing protein
MVSQSSDMGAPTIQPRQQRVAVEWLSFSSLALGLVLSSSSNVFLRWLGLAALAGGALVAWFSHLRMRSELSQASNDAQAWRAWSASCPDAVVVLDPPRDGWSRWAPRQEETQGPVVSSANVPARAQAPNKADANASQAPNHAPLRPSALWPEDLLSPLLDTVYQLSSQPATSEPRTELREVGLHTHDKALARWWQLRVVRVGDRLLVQTQDITELRAAQRALHEREAFYHTLVDSLPVGIFARSTQPKTAGQYIVWNKHAADVLNVSSERILGTKGDHLLSESWITQANAQDLQVLREPGLHRFSDLNFTTPKGERIVDLIKTPVYDADGDIDHILVIAQDVTEQRQAANQLQLASCVVDETADAVVVSDAVDRVVMVNPSFLRMTGLGMDKVVGQSAELLGLSPLRESHLPGVSDALKAGERWSGESRQLCRDGQQLDTWLSVSTLRSAKGAIAQHIRVFSDISALKAHQRELNEQARHDSLTGLPNRRAFGERLNQAMARARRGTRSLTVLFIDLDGFKSVNDQHGHAAGDTLLIAVAHRLQDCVRLTDTVCRLAGDEFTVILEGADQMDEVQIVCRRIVERLCEPHQIGGTSLVVSPSIGASVYETGDTADSLCQRSDGAMYAAKHAGKARYVLADRADAQPHPAPMEVMEIAAASDLTAPIRFAAGAH